MHCNRNHWDNKHVKLIVIDNFPVVLTKGIELLK